MKKGDYMSQKASAININNIYRNKAFKIVDASAEKYSEKEFSEAIISTILQIKENNYETYKGIISSIYPIYYIENKYFEMPESKLLKNPFANYDMGDIFDTITSFDELDCVIDSNPKLLINMLAYTGIFTSRTFLESREIFLKTSSYDSYLTNINQFYFLDKFDYSCKIEGNNLYELYNINFCNKAIFSKKPLNMLEAVDKESKQEICFFLENLSFYDMKAYSYLIDEVLFDSYRYLKFLNENNALEESKIKLLSFLEKDNVTFEDYLNITLDENDLNNEDNFLFNIVDSYILYKNKGIAFEETLNKYFENNENTIKVKRIGNKGLK